MLRKLRPRSVYDVMAAIACFGVLAGGTAYAANTVFSSDIADGEVKTPDLATDAVSQAKLRDAAVGRPELASAVVSREKINNGAVDATKVADNSLAGSDIVESGLGKVPDADNLDGIDSTGFVQGFAANAEMAIAQHFSDERTLGSPPFVTVGYGCPLDLSTNGSFSLRNDRSSAANLFVDDGSTNPAHVPLAAGPGTTFDNVHVRQAVGTGELFTFHIQWGDGAQAVIWASLVHRADRDDCHVQVQVLQTD